MDLAVPSNPEALGRLAIALCIGLFVGLEREYSQSAKETAAPAGMRTLALVSLLGGATAYLSILLSPWMLAAGYLVLGAITVASYVEALRQRTTTGGLGVTSEIGALLTFTLGALAMTGELTVAGVLAVATTVILSAKQPLHTFVHSMGQADLVATIQFAVITFIVLPILPHKSYGPYGAFNPWTTWLMVVLIAGVGFLGYALTKFIGAERGIALSSLVGGLASSTAVTLGNAKRSRVVESLSPPLATGVVLACAMMVPRVALIVAAINRDLIVHCAVPMLSMFAGTLAFTVLMHRRSRNLPSTDEAHETQHVNPFEMGPALKFAVAFAIISFLVKWTKAVGASAGVYVISGVSGLAQVDAAVISLAQQANLDHDTVLATRGIMLTIIVNTLFKGGIAWWVGSRELGRRVLMPLTAVAILGIVTTLMVR